MLECASISNQKSSRMLRSAVSVLLLAVALTHFNATALAADDRTQQPDEDDFSSTPGLEYGDFNEEAEEAEATRFFQFGRFFGVSFGLNYEGATGNRGRLWKPSFPGLDFRFHYWFDFQLAMELGIYTAGHSYDAPIRGGANDANITWFGFNFKYYIPTRDLSSGITFASPFIAVGAGSYAKSESNPNNVAKAPPDKDAKFGFSAGAGLEFAIAPRKSYFILEGKAHFVHFKDTQSTVFSNEADGGLPDLTGMLYTFTGSFLFTW